jgi:hypothetical protein
VREREGERERERGRGRGRGREGESEFVRGWLGTRGRFKGKIPQKKLTDWRKILPSIWFLRLP